VTQAFSLACTGPIVSMTGIAGFTLGGGLGWLSCDNLLAAEVVTAGGEIIHASETENNDLLWGLKGAGWNFGVVTTMELRLHWPNGGRRSHLLASHPVFQPGGSLPISDG
jgi:FAD/FMN-containing dehydrogenase